MELLLKDAIDLVEYREGVGFGYDEISEKYNNFK